MCSDRNSLNHIVIRILNSLNSVYFVIQQIVFHFDYIQMNQSFSVVAQTLTNTFKLIKFNRIMSKINFNQRQILMLFMLIIHSELLCVLGFVNRFLNVFKRKSLKYFNQNCERK